MPADITGERFYSYRKPAWHKMGLVSDLRLGAVEALEATDSDVQIRLIPAPPVVTEWGDLPTGDKLYIVRAPLTPDGTPAVLGLASKGYELMQNREVCELLDKEVTGQYPVETMGVLAEGATFFVALRGEPGEIAGEEIERYFLLNDTRDGKSAFQMSYTPVRVVCRNTLLAGLDQALVTSNVRHNTLIRDEVNWRVKLLAQMADVQQKNDALFERLAATKATDAQVKKVIVGAYPVPNKPQRVRIYEEMVELNKERIIAEAGRTAGAYKKALTGSEWKEARMENLRAAALEQYVRIADEAPKIAGTLYGAYMAVNELENHRTHDGSDSDEAHASGAVSTLYGWRARTMARALTTAVGLLKK